MCIYIKVRFVIDFFTKLKDWNRKPEPNIINGAELKTKTD